MIVGEIDKSINERLRVIVKSYKNKKYVDIRMYWQDEQGEWRPSKKGIIINAETLDEVNELLRKAARELKNADR